MKGVRIRIWERKNRQAYYADVIGPKGEKLAQVKAGATRTEALRTKVELEAHYNSPRPAKPEAEMTVAEAAERWLAEREGKPNERHERGHFQIYILPELGQLRVGELSRRHVRKFVKGLEGKTLEKTGRPPSAHYVRGIHGVLSSLCSWLVDDLEILESNPCALGRGKLPKTTAVEKRHQRARETFSRAEVETLISSPKIDWVNRVAYALTFFTAARRSEGIELRWSDTDEEATPLAKIVVARTHERDTTKTGVPREVPRHPTLAAILAEWHATGFASRVGRSPRSDDPIIPREDGLAYTGWWLWNELKADLKILGFRHRGVHAFRRAFESIALGDGAPRDCIKFLLHPSDRDITDVYFAPEWSALCAAVQKVNVVRRSSDDPTPDAGPVTCPPPARSPARGASDFITDRNCWCPQEDLNLRLRTEDPASWAGLDDGDGCVTRDSCAGQGWERRAWVSTQRTRRDAGGRLSGRRTDVEAPHHRTRAAGVWSDSGVRRGRASRDCPPSVRSPRSNSRRGFPAGLSAAARRALRLDERSRRHSRRRSRRTLRGSVAFSALAMAGGPGHGFGPGADGARVW